MRKSAALGLVVGALLAAGGPSVAQEGQSVGVFTDWSVFNPSEPERQCFIVSPPVKTRAERNGSSVTVRRGDIRLFVTARPGQPGTEVSYTAGYPFRPDSTVAIRIGDETFTLYVGNEGSDGAEWAWPASPDEDGKLVAAMRKGAEAEVSGTSARGTTTFDTFSLNGFSAALDKAVSLCQ